MGRGQGTLAAVATASTGKTERTPFVLHLSSESVVSSSEINFSWPLRTSGVDIWDVDQHTSVKNFLDKATVDGPIEPWTIASKILDDYTLRAQKKYEDGLRATNPQSRKKAPKVDISPLDKLAMIAIVESQQLSPSDFRITAYTGYYGPEIDKIYLESNPSQNIDLLARAYFALPADNPRARLAWIIQGAEGSTPEELESPADIITANVPFKKIIGTEPSQGEVQAAWSRKGGANPYHSLNEDQHGSTHPALESPLAVVTPDGNNYRVLLGAQHIRTLDTELWKRKTVPVVVVR
jgi:hypothetical protein